MDLLSLFITIAVVAVVGVTLLVVFRSPSTDDQEDTTQVLATPLPAGVLAAVARPGFRPTCEERETTGPVSKFSGCPWLPAGTEWPVCSLCKRPMQLFLQLDLDGLPEGAPPARGGGLLQLFYCTDTDEECEQDEGWDGQTTSMKLARIVDPSGPGSTPSDDASFDPQPAHTITGWERDDDYPDFDDLELFFPELAESVRKRILADEEYVTLMGDKLGGWPDWVQGNEWHDCGTCGARMELLFQIEGEEHIGYMFGDLGTGHLLRCPQHPEQMTFGWACH